MISGGTKHFCVWIVDSISKCEQQYGFNHTRWSEAHALYQKQIVEILNVFPQTNVVKSSNFSCGVSFNATATLMHPEIGWNKSLVSIPLFGSSHINHPEDVFSCRNSLVQPYVKPVTIDDSSDDDTSDVEDDDYESAEDSAEEEQVWDVNFNKWYMFKKQLHLKKDCLSEEEIKLFGNLTSAKKVEHLAKKGIDDFPNSVSLHHVQEFHNAFVCGMHDMVDFLIAKPWELCHMPQTQWHAKIQSMPNTLMREHSRFCALYCPGDYEALYVHVTPKKTLSLTLKRSSPKQTADPFEFTPDEEEMFAKRFDEGYDLTTDERYNAWKSRKEVNEIVMDIINNDGNPLSHSGLEKQLDMPSIGVLTTEVIDTSTTPTEAIEVMDTTPTEVKNTRTPSIQTLPPTEVKNTRIPSIQTLPPTEVKDTPTVPPPTEVKDTPAPPIQTPPSKTEVVTNQMPSEVMISDTSTQTPSPKSRKRHMEDEQQLGKDELNISNLPEKLASRLTTLMEFNMHPVIHGRLFGVSDALPHVDWNAEALQIFYAIDEISDLTFNTHCSIQQDNRTIIHCRSDVVLECIKKRSLIEETLQTFFKFVTLNAELFEKEYQELLHEKKDVEVVFGEDRTMFSLSLQRHKKYKLAVVLRDEDGKTIDEQCYDI